jgi:hypothetical protein
MAPGRVDLRHIDPAGKDPTGAVTPYRPAARRPQMIDTGMSHVRFRCVPPDAAG